MASYKIKICNFKYKKVFSIKNVSILNGHNFGPERRTEIKKKNNLKCELLT